MAARLDCPSLTNDTGAYRITWSNTGDEPVRLEEDGALVYEGHDDATTVSGRLEGDYVYRIGVVEEGRVSWTDECTVTVAPPSLALAFSLFGVGVIVFTSLLVVVVRGHRAHRRGELR